MNEAQKAKIIIKTLNKIYPKAPITLNHEAFDRALYSDGALTASKWLMKKKPGLYSMRDLLNFS